ncbi:MAG: CARDB domain-containing protein, partial [Bacteroidota bacterium]
SLSLAWSGLNAGAPFEDSWVDQIYLCPTPNTPISGCYYIGQQSVSDSLDTQETYSTQREVTIPGRLNGSYYLRIFTDGFQQINEGSLEDNNTAQQSINIQSPDLEAVLAPLPASAVSDQSLSIEWQLQNNGPGALLEQGVQQWLYFSESLPFDPQTAIYAGMSSDFLSLEAGESANIQQDIYLPPGFSGTYYLTLITNPNQAVFENDLTANNQVSSTSPIQIEVAQYPDLQGQSLVINNQVFQAGDSISITYSAINNGPGEIDQNWNDAFYLSTNPNSLAGGVLLGKKAREDRLAAQETYSDEVRFSIPSYLNAGTYFLFLLSDQDNQLFEFQAEDNNILAGGSISVERYPEIDIRLTKALLEANIEPGMPASLLWSVQNGSNFNSLADQWEDALYLSTNQTWEEGEDLLIHTWPRTSGLGIGQNYSRVASFIVPNNFSGTYYLIMVADHLDANADINVANNYRVLSLSEDSPDDPVIIEFPPQSDLVLTQLNAADQATAGQPFQVSYEVRNQGEGDLEDRQWTDALWLSKDETLGSGDLLLSRINQSHELAIGEGYTDNFSFEMPLDVGGNCFLLVNTDNGNRIRPELSEENNVQAHYIFLSQPDPADLVVTHLRNPQEAEIGDEISVSWEVENIGAFPINGQMQEAVYLSTDDQWDADDLLLGQHTVSINLPPLGRQEQSLSGRISRTAQQPYRVIVKTDLLNNFAEDNEENNESPSPIPLQIEVPELPLNSPTPAQVEIDFPLVHRIQIPKALAGESMLVQLVDGAEGPINRLYLSHEQVPSPSSFEESSIDVFEATPMLILSNLQEGTYYLLTEQESGASATQDITLFASILEFSITSIQSDVGGNTGQLTALINGGQFEEAMGVSLSDGNLSIPAINFSLIDRTAAYVTFDLVNQNLGTYDVVITNADGDTDRLIDGFEIVEGEKLPPKLTVRAPASARPDQSFSFILEMENLGNVDIPAPAGSVFSLEGNPIARSVEELNVDYNDESVYIDFMEPGAPFEILRPGTKSTIFIYSKAEENTLRFFLNDYK